MSNDPDDGPQEISRREKIFMGVIAIFVLMSIGPGIALVNRPVFIGPIPLLYAWTILWFFLFLAAILIASKTIWTSDDSEENR